MSIGKIIFSKDKSFEAGYYVEDPLRVVNKFLLLKLDRFGFIDVDDKLLSRMSNGEKFPLEKIEEKYRYAITGNRLGNFEYHLPSILSVLVDGGTVWVSSQLLPQIEDKIKAGELPELEGVKVIVVDQYDEELDRGFVTKDSISILLGLLGKFFGKDMSEKESHLVGRLQEELKHGKDVDISEEGMKAVFDMIDRLYQREAEERDIPPANIFNKVKEALSYV